MASSDSIGAPVAASAHAPADFVAAVRLHRQGRADEARPLYRAVMVDSPAPVRRAAASNLGRIELAARRFAEAAACFRASLAVDSAQPDVLAMLGEALLAAGDPRSAIEPLRKVVVLRPDEPRHAHDLARALERAGDRPGARATLQALLERRPIDAPGLRLLKGLDIADGEPATALARYDAALASAPDAAELWFDRGLALRDLGRSAESAEAFGRAAALAPDSAETHNNHGRSLQEAGDAAGAAAAYRRAVALSADLWQPRLNLAALAMEAGRFAEAAAGFASVLSLRPGDDGALAGLVHARQHACDWAGLDAQRENLLARVAAGAPVPPFLAVAAGCPDAWQRAGAAAWAAAVAPRRRPRPPARLRGGETIRLGYLSGDFHDHATAVLVAELIERHDRDAFRVHGYSYGPDDGSAMRARMRAGFDAFVDLAGIGDEAAADRIRRDGIDILVDLKGYTAGARPQIVALRPAPIQVNWLGFPGTMGADFIDVALADATTAPPSLDRHCAETILRLPDCFQPTDTTRPVAAARPRAEYGLPEDGFVFCCFNNSYKITPEVFAVWMRLLGAVPGSVLWLLEGSAEARANLVREAAGAGIDPARLVFAPRLPMSDHLARHRAADLFLDTRPVNALTTASDALWAGLPVLTCLGDTVSGRGCASLVRAAGLPELVAPDLVRYEILALHFARAPERLAAVRERLWAARATAPLFDTPRFARNLEAAFRKMADEAAARDATRPAPDDFDHMGEAWATDAPAVWADLRARCPLARTHRHGGITMPTRYEDIRAVAYDPRGFSSIQVVPATFPPGGAARDHAIPPLTSDPPRHRDDRMLLMAALSPRVAARIEPEAARLARHLLHVLPDGPEVDAARDYAHPLALGAMCRLLGIRDGGAGEIGRLAEAVLSLAPDDAFADAMDGLARAAAAEVRHRIDHPGEDLVSHLLALRRGVGPLPTAAVKSLIRTLLIAGIDTVSSAIGAALDHLSRRPDLAGRLVREPGLLPEAVEELLRLGAHANLLRRATSSGDVGDGTVEAGELVLLSFGTANRDPDAFPDPDEVVFGRPASPAHVAFGAGIHRCAGQHVARMLVSVAIREWLAAIPSFAPGTGITAWSRGVVRGPIRLPIAVRRPASIAPAPAPRAAEPERREAGTVHAALRLDLAGHEAAVFVRGFNMGETRRTLICLHGFLYSGLDLLPLGEAAAARGWRVLIPDWPGRGRSDDLPPERYTLATYAAVVRACLASAPGEVDLLGCSFGTLAAVAFLAGTGTAFGTAVLVDPILRGGPAYDALGRAMIDELWTSHETLDGLAASQSRFNPNLRLLGEDALRGYLAARATRVDGKFRIPCDPALAASLEAGIGRNFDLVGDLAAMRGRVTIVFGEDSPFKGPDVLAAVSATRPDATIVTDFRGGHAPLLRSAEEIGRVLGLLDTRAPAA